MKLGRMLKKRKAIVENQHLEFSSQIDNPVLKVSNLSKQYQDGLWANQDVSFVGNAGEILGILGPNGAGKTTLVRQLTTELLPTSGSAEIFGRDVAVEPGLVKSHLGIVPQEVTLFDYLTVHQHLRIFAKFRGVRPGDAPSVVDNLIQELELTGYRDVEVKNLSGGLRRRVLIGIASVGQPSVMFLDEPTTGLDPQSRRSLWSWLRKTRAKGAFVLLTTHSMEEAEALCDRVGIIHGGKMLALDTVPNLRAKYGYRFKLTYYIDDPITGSGSEPTVLYGFDDQELVERMKKEGINEFSVGRTSLEDVYLYMTGGLEGFNGSDG